MREFSLYRFLVKNIIIVYYEEFLLLINPLLVNILQSIRSIIKKRWSSPLYWSIYIWNLQLVV